MGFHSLLQGIFLTKGLNSDLLCLLQWQVDSLPLSPLGIPYRCPAMLSHSVMPNSLRPHGLQPARLLCPWGFSRQEYWSGLLMPSSRGSSQPRDQTQVSPIAGGFFTVGATREALDRLHTLRHILVDLQSDSLYIWIFYPPLTNCVNSRKWAQFLGLLIYKMDINITSYNIHGD